MGRSALPYRSWGRYPSQAVNLIHRGGLVAVDM